MMSKETISQALDADFAEPWKPRPGGSLVGVVTAISERDGGFGTYPIVTLLPDGGEPLAVHAFHHVLADELAKAKPKVGERLGVKYVGKVDSGERPYNSYRVAVDRPNRGVDWSRYSEDVAGEVEPTTASPGLELADAMDASDDDGPVPF